MLFVKCGMCVGEQPWEGGEKKQLNGSVASRNVHTHTYQDQITWKSWVLGGRVKCCFAGPNGTEGGEC